MGAKKKGTHCKCCEVFTNSESIQSSMLHHNVHEKEIDYYETNARKNNAWILLLA